MFDDQNNQTQNTDNVSSDQPSVGLGTNPQTFAPSQTPVDNAAPQVVMPDPAASTGQITDPSASDSSSDDTSAASPPVIDSSASGTETGQLADLKRKALDQLSPLVNQLDQSPEERYKTLMMMIQASDNQDLLSEAYDAAQKITDEKAKAEALLNIVNEINYFTQQKN